MDALITRRQRRRCAFVVLLAVSGSFGAASVAAADTAVRFRVDATIERASSSPSDATFRLGVHLVPARASHMGGGYALSAAVDSPSGCASDTIFADDFDP